MLSRMTAAALAIALCSYLPALPPLWWLLPMLPAALLWALCRRQSRWAGCLLAALLGGIYGCAYGHWRVGQLLPEVLEGRDLQAQLRVLSRPEQRGVGRRYFRFDAELAQLRCPQAECPQGLRKVRLNWYLPEPPQLGQRLTAQVRLKRPRGYASPGAFDYGRWLVAQGYSAVGYVREVTAMAPVSDGGAWSPSRWRQQHLADMAGQLAPYPQAGVMRALLFGDRSGLSNAHWQTLAATGTSHLMAISGMHIGIVAAWGVFVGRCLSGILRRAHWAIRAPPLLAAAVALVYSAMAGFSLPTQRALIMLSLLLVAQLLQRSISPWYTLVAALLLVLIVDPLAAHSAGFFLSFGAVFLLYWAFSGYWQARRQWALLALVKAQWVLGLGLLPALAVWGFGFAPGGLLANLFAIPLVAALILPLLLTGFVLQQLGLEWAQYCWWGADQLLQILFWLLSLCQRLLPLLPLRASPAAVLLMIPALLLLTQRLLPGWRLLPVLALPLLFVGPPRPEPGGFQAWVLDVGQGLSILIITHRHQLLFDVGPDFDSGFNTADAVVLPALRHAGIAKLDRLILSHGDRDHAGAAPALLAAVPVATLHSGEPVVGLGRRQQSCHHGQQWQWDGVLFRYLSSAAAQSRQGNDASCVLQISAGDQALLLTGDIATATEAQLLRQHGDGLLSTVLVAPHHGSNTSSSAAFIERVAPTQVVFSAAYKHAYGHPAAVVLARYQRRHRHCWQTALHGSVVVDIDANGLQRQAGWRRQRFYWQLPTPPPDCQTLPRD